MIPLPTSLFVTLAALAATPTPRPPAPASDLRVTVSYLNAEDEVIDESKPIFLFIADGPGMGGGGDNLLAVEEVHENGDTLRIRDLPETVYLAALYDPSGNFSGLSGMIPGSVMAGYAEEGATQPSAVKTGERKPIVFSFDASAGRVPGDPDSVVPRRIWESTTGVVEIRTYTIQPGKREAFVDFFENKTLNAQKKIGLEVAGQFRSLEDDDTFVWIRTYPSQAERVKLNRRFYLSRHWLAINAEASSLIANTRTLLVAPTERSKLH